jgi:hypothetical protein
LIAGNKKLLILITKPYCLTIHPPKLAFINTDGRWYKASRTIPIRWIDNNEVGLRKSGVTTGKPR